MIRGTSRDGPVKRGDSDQKDNARQIVKATAHRHQTEDGPQPAYSNDNPEHFEVQFTSDSGAPDPQCNSANGPAQLQETGLKSTPAPPDYTPHPPGRVLLDTGWTQDPVSSRWERLIIAGTKDNGRRRRWMETNIAVFPAGDPPEDDTNTAGMAGVRVPRDPQLPSLLTAHEAALT